MSFAKYTTMTIGSYYEAKKVANGRYVKSRPISAGGHTWRIAFYPNGRLAGTTASMSLFLLLDDDDAAAAGEDVVVQARFRFTMNPMYERKPVFVSGTVDGAFSRSRRWGNAYGFERFVSRDDFEKTPLFKTNIGFQIECFLTVFPPASKRAAAVQTSRSARPAPSVVPPPASPKPSTVRVPPSAPLPTTPATPTPSAVRATVPPAPASPKPSAVTTTVAPPPPMPPPASPKPSVVRVPPSSPPPTPATPTPSVVNATVPPAPASPKPSAVTTTAAPSSPESTTLPAPSVTMSSTAPPSSIRLRRPDPLVTGVSGPPASVPAGAGQKSRVPPPPPLSGLPADLGRLLATKKAADVDLEVCGEVFAAHKAVLAARSPVFMEELFGVAKEEDTSYVLVVPDMRPAAFEALLHYLYTDTLPPEMDMTMSSPEQGAAVTVLAEDLLAAADRYELKDLKLLTENKLCYHVGVGTVLPMLTLAERFQCCKLKKTCLGFIGSCGNTRAVMATNGLEILAMSSPSVVKDVITEILDAAEARRRRGLTYFCVFAFCFILPFLVFAILAYYGLT